MADALQLEFVPDGNNEEVLGGWRNAPLPRLPKWRALIPTAEDPFP